MQAGSVLGGKYRLDSVLGQGGMGAVWRGEHLSLAAPVAIKLMDANLAQTADGLARFHREAHAAASIRSQNVVQILDHGVDEATNTPFIVMELLDGETLGKRLNRLKRLSIAATAIVVDEVCRALTRAHQAGIVHRDLKPENIFIVKDDHEFSKVLDFGVAKANAYGIGVGEGTRTGALIGTPFYMSPEQIRGAKEIDGRSDLWSLAVIACECVTGRRPFDEATVGGLAIAICADPVPLARSLGPATPAFELWLERALARDPARRFQTARELSDALRAVSEAPESVRELSGVAGSALSPPQSSRFGSAVPLTQLESVPALRSQVKALTTASPLSHTFAEPKASAPKKPAPVSLIAAACGALALVGAGAWFLRGGSTPEAGAGRATAEDQGAVELAQPREPASDKTRVAPRAAPRDELRDTSAAGTAQSAERPRVQVVSQPPESAGGEAVEPSPTAEPASPKPVSAKLPASGARRPTPAPRTAPKAAAPRPVHQAPAPPVPKVEEPPAPAPAPTPAKPPARAPNLIDALSGER